MKFRKDITDYIVSVDKNYKKKDYKIFEDDGFLFHANYFYENPRKVKCYTPYNLFWHQDQQQLKKDVEEKFKVKFDQDESVLVCRCGERKMFSAHYGSYEIFLRCNKCGNNFSAYSG